MPGGREAALRAMERRRRYGGKLEDALRAACEGLDAREAALAARICFGVTQKAEPIGLGLSQYANLNRAHPGIADILYAGAYQIWFMDRVPRHAVVNESVRMARKIAPHAAGMVNAVLRKLPQTPPATGDPRAAHSIPRWMWDAVAAEIGEDGTAEFFRACDEITPVTACRNPLKRRGENMGERPHPSIPGCCFLDGPAERSEAVKRGELIVADAASRLCALAVGAAPGESVWDVCAAPGGKSAMLAFDMDNTGEILATDISPSRLERLSDAMERLGVTIVRAIAGDGRNYLPVGAFDAVLCDVPCSGLGVLRKKPDIRLKKYEDIDKLPETQLAILRGASRHVKPGGTLVYSTCTVLSRENGEVVGSFLAGNPGFALEPFSLPGIGDCPGGSVTLWPHIHGTDGFFIAKMKRV